MNKKDVCVNFALGQIFSTSINADEWNEFLNSEQEEFPEDWVVWEVFDNCSTEEIIDLVDDMSSSMERAADFINSMPKD